MSEVLLALSCQNDCGFAKPSSQLNSNLIQWIDDAIQNPTQYSLNELNIVAQISPN